MPWISTAPRLTVSKGSDSKGLGFCNKPLQPYCNVLVPEALTKIQH